MSSAVDATARAERDDLPMILRKSVVIGLFTAVAVLLLSFITRFTEGAVETGLGLVVLAAGVYVVGFLPGLWTNARTIDGISAAAGIGLAATVVFLVVDVTLLQPIGTYTNRWRAIGGGSNWWHHPIWWMVGTYLPWMGAYIIANQAARGGVNLVKAFGLVGVFTVVFGVLAVALHVPHASYGLGTFGVAILPALAVATLVSGLGAKRS